MAKKIYVEICRGRLHRPPWNLFSTHGTVTSSEVISDREKPAFTPVSDSVEMESDEACQRPIEALNGTEVDAAQSTCRTKRASDHLGRRRATPPPPPCRGARSRASFHGDAAAVNFRSVEGLDGPLAGSSELHSHESENRVNGRFRDLK